MVSVDPPDIIEHAGPRPVLLDPYRAFQFPNRIRELRVRHGFPKLLGLASALPNIPYIRLSKIERGEVVARADEIAQVAGLLGVAPRDLLVDVDDPGFDIAAWAEPFQDRKAADDAEETFAVLLGAAIRARRAQSASLTIAAIERDFGIPPVILSRLEHAFKPLGRWNGATVDAVCAFFGVADAGALRRAVEKQYAAGLLDDYLATVVDPIARIQKTRLCIAELRQELASANVRGAARGKPEPFAEPPIAAAEAEPAGPGAGEAPQPVRLLAVLGAPVSGGLISPIDTGLTVEAPRAAGPRAFALKICRPSLGPGLPGNAVVIADPDVFPSSGGLALVRERGNFRLLSVTFDRHGAMFGYSVNPEMEMPLDKVDPAHIAAILSASFL